VGWDKHGTGGAYHGAIKYKMMTNIICCHLVATSLLAMWHLEAVSEMSEGSIGINIGKGYLLWCHKIHNDEQQIFIVVHHLVPMSLTVMWNLNSVLQK